MKNPIATRHVFTISLYLCLLGICGITSASQLGRDLCRHPCPPNKTGEDGVKEKEYYNITHPFHEGCKVCFENLCTHEDEVKTCNAYDGPYGVTCIEVFGKDLEKPTPWCYCYGLDNVAWDLSDCPTLLKLAVKSNDNPYGPNDVYVYRNGKGKFVRLEKDVSYTGRIVHLKQLKSVYGTRITHYFKDLKDLRDKTGFVVPFELLKKESYVT